MNKKALTEFNLTLCLSRCFNEINLILKENNINVELSVKSYFNSDVQDNPDLELPTRQS